VGKWYMLSNLRHSRIMTLCSLPKSTSLVANDTLFLVVEMELRN
jgi:hypothetical protein